MTKAVPKMPWKPFIKSGLLWSVISGSLFILGMRYIGNSVDKITVSFILLNVVVWGGIGLAMANWNRQRVIKQSRTKS